MALQTYLRQSRQGLEMQNRAAEIRIRSERRWGEILAAIEKNPGGQSEHKSYLSQDGTGRTSKLSDLGITRNQSSRWQLIASISEQEFEERLEFVKTNGKELTSAEMLSFAGYLQRERERQERRKRSAQAGSRGGA